MKTTILTVGLLTFIQWYHVPTTHHHFPNSLHNPDQTNLSSCLVLQCGIFSNILCAIEIEPDSICTATVHISHNMILRIRMIEWLKKLINCGPHKALRVCLVSQWFHWNHTDLLSRWEFHFWRSQNCQDLNLDFNS